METTVRKLTADDRADIRYAVRTTSLNAREAFSFIRDRMEVGQSAYSAAADLAQE